jgi:hypothetical protein
MAKYLRKVQVQAWYVRANFVWAIVTEHRNTEYKSVDTGYYTSVFIYSMYAQALMLMLLQIDDHLAGNISVSKNLGTGSSPTFTSMSHRHRV